MITVKPIFRIFDYNKAIEFYVKWLGCKVDWEHTFGENFPVYMQVSLRDFQLHLSEHHNSCSPGSHVHVENFEELKAFHQKLIVADYTYNKPGIGKATWNENVTAMEVIDPFRNIITFSENKLFVPDND